MQAFSIQKRLSWLSSAHLLGLVAAGVFISLAYLDVDEGQREFQPAVSALRSVSELRSQLDNLRLDDPNLSPALFERVQPYSLRYSGFMRDIRGLAMEASLSMQDSADGFRALLACQPRPDSPGCRALTSADARSALLNRTRATLSFSQQRLLDTTLHVVQNRHLTLDAYTRASALAIAVSALLAMFTSVGIIRSVLRPLRKSVETLQRLATSEVDVSLPQDSTEFTAIGQALENLRSSRQRLREEALLDPLTHLGSRSALEKLLNDLIANAPQSNRPFAVLKIDLDGFRRVNEDNGISIGNQYLIEACRRLSLFIAPGVSLFREGADTFVLAVSNLHPDETPRLQIQTLAIRVISALTRPVHIDGRAIPMSASLGASLYPDDGVSPDEILIKSDSALRSAKSEGPGSSQLFSTGFSEKNDAHRHLAADIERGIAAGEFEPFFQPIVDVEGRKVYGAEALLRWRHPTRGLLMPSAFIEVAEGSGLIVPLGSACLKVAVKRAHEWRRLGRDYRIAVNLSSRQVVDGSILETLQAIVDQYPDASTLIDFELTESVLLDSGVRAQTILHQIVSMGFRIGLDDFGTGYSSFSYLNKLPIYKIKIDRQFVNDMESSRVARSIVSAIVTLADSLDYHLVSEGIETPDQARKLRLLGCALQQGYHYAKPLPADEFSRWCDNFSLRPEAPAPLSFSPLAAPPSSL